jgi:hypothetical protein
MKDTPHRNKKERPCFRPKQVYKQNRVAVFSQNFGGRSTILLLLTLSGQGVMYDQKIRAFRQT